MFPSVVVINTFIESSCYSQHHREKQMIDCPINLEFLTHLHVVLYLEVREMSWKHSF